MSKRIDDAFLLDPFGNFVGDDLTDEHLDDLYECVALGESEPGEASYWFRDKSHQILRRLLVRLARAEGAQNQEPTSSKGESSS